MARHRVMLVREWDQQTGSSGCCGRLDSATVSALHESCENPYERARQEMDRIGAAYRALRSRFDEDDVELVIVDPRNMVWLLPAVWRDARRRGLPAGEALRQANGATKACTLVCDGKVLGADLTPEQAVAAVESDLEPRATVPQA